MDFVLLTTRTATRTVGEYIHIAFRKWFDPCEAPKAHPEDISVRNVLNSVL